MVFEKYKMEELVKDSEFQKWANHKITQLLQQEDVEDFLYEYRKELTDENSMQIMIRSYILWIACRVNRKKQDIEALYNKGYRMFHTEDMREMCIEVKDFGWNFRDSKRNEKEVLDIIQKVIFDTLKKNKYPAVLLEDYEKTEEFIRASVRNEILIKAGNLGILDKGDLRAILGELNKENRRQEKFLVRLEQVYPQIYKDLLNISIEEFCFCTRTNPGRYNDFMQRYLEYHKEPGFEKELKDRLKKFHNEER